MVCNTPQQYSAVDRKQTLYHRHNMIILVSDGRKEMFLLLFSLSNSSRRWELLWEGKFYSFIFCLETDYCLSLTLPRQFSSQYSAVTYYCSASGGGTGVVVVRSSVQLTAFISDNPSSNPAKAYSFSVKKERGRGRPIKRLATGSKILVN